mgnify:CR=1
MSVDAIAVTVREISMPCTGSVDYNLDKNYFSAFVDVEIEASVVIRLLDSSTTDKMVSTFLRLLCISMAAIAGKSSD